MVYNVVKNKDSSDRDAVVHVSGVKILYGSQTGTAKVEILFSTTPSQAYDAII